MIQNGETGLLYPVGDIDAMAAGAVDLLTNPERRATMGKAGRRDAQKRFCSTRIIPLYEKYYEEILARSA